MIKVIAIGDVHGQWEELWRALRAAMAADAQGQPTPQVLDGRFQVVIMGDLVHYKNSAAYAEAAGVPVYDPKNAEHLEKAASAQIAEIYRFKGYVDAANGNVTVILGNHDEAAVTCAYALSSRGGLKHNEFHPDKGGIPMPDDLKGWFTTFPRERVFYNVHFSHAGPLPGMQFYDDLFYHDHDTKSWYLEKPNYMQHTTYRFGVYGHTVMPRGIYVDKKHGFAMVDALSTRQFFEMILSEDKLEYRVMQY